MNPEEAYKELSNRSKEIAHLQSAMELSYWDQRTHPPARGHAHRASHVAALARMRYRRFTEPRIGELLSAVEQSPLVDNPLSNEAVNVREWRRLHDRLARIPEKLAVDITRATAEAEAVWETVVARNGWTRFRPHLERIVALKRAEADALGYEKHPYDALLSEYEPETTTESVSAILRLIGGFVLRLLDRVRGSTKPAAPFARQLYFPMRQQEAFAKYVARRVGYKLDAGRVDVSAHPFSIGIGPEDVRITVRFDENNFSEGLFAVAHEAGHAMYAQCLPLEHWGHPICHAASVGIDESQALLWENLVARSLGFWRHFYPLAQRRFTSLRDMSVDEFHFSLNRVTPRMIRLNADEATYNLHILIRFELEIALIDKDLEVSDLPDAWNAKTLKYLGQTPPDYSRGLMQDVHWASGLIGYFPTYSLGHAYAAQFFAQAERELGKLDDQFARGEFRSLREWLRKKIYIQGARYTPRQLVKRVTGEDLDARYLINHLETKYCGLYDLQAGPEVCTRRNMDSEQ